MALVAFLVGCAEPPPCATMADGTCDEPGVCAFGSDEADCAASCADEPWPPEVVGACAHRAASISGPDVDPEAGSGGQGGPYGAWDGTVTVRGETGDEEIERQFRVYVPATVDPEVPAPVMFSLGGFTVDMYGLADYTELDRTADLGAFIVIYGNPPFVDFGGDYGWVYAWYVYNQNWTGPWSDNPDLAFLRAVRDQVAGLYNIDRTRTFTSGHSRGAALSLIAAFEMPDIFAGFLWASGFLTNNDYDTRALRVDPARLPTAFMTHGEPDPDVPVSESDTLVGVYEELGGEEGVDFVYERLPDVGHEWQPQFNQAALDLLRGRPLDVEDAAP